MAQNSFCRKYIETDLCHLTAQVLEYLEKINIFFCIFVIFIRYDSLYYLRT